MIYWMTGGTDVYGRKLLAKRYSFCLKFNQIRNRQNLQGVETVPRISQQIIKTMKMKLFDAVT